MTELKKRKIIIDTDPGIDDAAAMAVAFRHPALDIQLITTMGANVTVDKTTANALKLVEFFDVDIPVAKGCPGPLIKPHENLGTLKCFMQKKKNPQIISEKNSECIQNDMHLTQF